MSENARQRLVRLDLPWPVEPMLQQVLAIEAPDRRHEELVLAWEAVFRVLGCTLLAVADHVGVASPLLDNQRSRLARPSFGDWAGVIRTTSGALAGCTEPAVGALQPLLEGLAQPSRDIPGLTQLSARLRSLPNKAVGPLNRLHDVLQAMPAYRNAAQSTHDSVATAFRRDSCSPLFDGLLSMAEAMPLLGRFHLVVIGRLERDEQGERADLYVMHGSGPVHDPRRLSLAVWNRLYKGRPYLFLEPDLFVPLYPLAAAEAADAGWRIGWLTGRVHSPTLAYHAGPRGSFQVPLSEADYRELLGNAPTAASADPAFLAREPYKGLLAYTEADASVFFGREEELLEAAERLVRDGVLIVVGASGSGKSSLLGAGLVLAERQRAAAQERDFVLPQL